MMKNLTFTVISLFICFCFIGCGQNNTIKNSTPNQNQQVNQQTNPQTNPQTNSQTNQQSSQQLDQNGQKKPEIEIIFYGDNNVDESIKAQFANALTDGLKVVWSRQEIRETYQKIKMKFMVTTDIRKLSSDKAFTGSNLPVTNKIVPTNSFYFASQQDNGQIDHFIVVDQQVFHNELSLVVALNHESLHAKHFLEKTAKDNFIDEEIQTYRESVKYLEDMYVSSGVEAKLPQKAVELRKLIDLEKDHLKSFEIAKTETSK